MKILFLDVDGVLNNWPALKRNGMTAIDAQCLQQLTHVVKNTGCKIVLSSSWRTCDNLKRTILEHFDKVGIDKWIGETPDLFARVRFNIPRAKEIQTWLENRTDVKRFAIVDDDADAGKGLEDHYFETSMDLGLTKKIANQIIKYLNEEETV